MIEFKNITHGYSSGSEVIKNFSLEIPYGELVALIGPSGAGKSTLLKMINRLVEPNAGSIEIDHQDIRKTKPVNLRRKIGYIIQQIGLFPHMTVWENATLVPRLCKIPELDWRDRVIELMELVDLSYDEYANRYPSQLSGGQQQRIGVVRALASDPPIVLMDEPFSALDPISREQLQDEILRIKRKYKKTIVLVTHDIDEALKLADRICILRDGKMIQYDTPEALRSEPRNKFVRQFIGESRLRSIRTLSEAMVPPVTINGNQRLWEGIRRMQRRRVDTLVVVGETERFEGVVTLWDMEARRKENDTLKVSELIDKDYPTLLDTSDLNTAISTLHEQRLSSLPVLNQDGDLVGVLTRTGLIEMIAEEMASQKNGKEE